MFEGGGGCGVVLLSLNLCMGLVVYFMHGMAFFGYGFCIYLLGMVDEMSDAICDTPLALFTTLLWFAFTVQGYMDLD